LSTKSSDGDASTGNALSEWQEARSILARYDNNLHDLRKYGFSFVTALLAANGLLSEGGPSIVPAVVKMAILVATMGLIVSLKLLDTNYRMFEKAASMRGRILENRLNLDITNDISFLYGFGDLWLYVQLLYYGLVTVTVILGLAILWGNALCIIWLLVGALVAYVTISLLDHVKPEPWQLEDWSVDNKIVSKGTPVRITYTNLNPGDGYYPGTFRLSWNVKDKSAMTEKAVKPTPPPPPPSEVQLRYFESQDWLWETEKVSPGLYELEMFSARVQRASSLRVMSIGRLGEGNPSQHATIQVTKVKPEEPIKVMLEKTGEKTEEKTGHS